jgi:hypothetical protein
VVNDNSGDQSFLYYGNSFSEWIHSFKSHGGMGVYIKEDGDCSSITDIADVFWENPVLLDDYPEDTCTHKQEYSGDK